MSRESVGIWLRSGRLRSVKTGKRAYHVTPEAIEELAHARAHAGKQRQASNR